MRARAVSRIQRRAKKIRLEAHSPAASGIQLAAEAIRAGGLVAFPTETVYGLGANAWDASAVEDIFRAKGRPANDPLIVHVAEFDQLTTVACDVPELAWDLGRRFWPGALTLVLKKSARIPANVTSGLETVAVRVPDHPIATALLEAAAVPIAAPSANRFSAPSPTRAQHVLDDLGDAVDIVLDAGETAIGVESTILSLVDGMPRLLRPGGVPLEDLLELIPGLGYSPHFLGEEDVAPAPGALLKHYSPRARLLLIRGDDAAVRAAIGAEIARHPNSGALVFDADAAALSHLDLKIERLGNDNRQAARRLFAAMRALDAKGVDLIIARAPRRRGLGLALWDRLLRAAEGAVIDV